ncbi:hypothetical protein AVEN_194616-1 [Araneus ventricosus]|uniref:Uncharacterized protein n=1 Tax=Araneus ventricosus TaxID=182803 RepID=A0A4Y2A6J9_ARAVE|nr:hypothetical protein AVEN_194616-1 [Araneus ventricosus]
MDLVILNRGQMARQTPHPTIPIPNSHASQAGRNSTLNVSLMCANPTYTTDLGRNQVSNLESFGLEAETFSLGDCGLRALKNVTSTYVICISKYGNRIKQK